MTKLFPRYAGSGGPNSHHRARPVITEKARAHRILDKLRLGLEVSPVLVRWALTETGDK